MQQVKCIIFDCDGVLVDSEPIGNRILLEMAEGAGLDMTLEEAYHYFNGRSLAACFQYIEDRIGRQLPDDFESAFRKQSFEAFQNELKPVSGVMEFIAKLQIPFCVASSGPVEKIVLNLTTTGLINHFEDKIFSAYQINLWKPDPGIFLHAAKEMGFEPDACVVIEDSQAGVMAAKNGGFRVFGLANPYNEKALKEHGAEIFYNFDELEQILRSTTDIVMLRKS